MPKSPQSSAACPRCGYDLQGQVDTWRVPLASQADVVRFESGAVLESELGAKCPVEGTCSECGLTFEWKFVFRPELAGPAWFVETRRVGRFRAWLGTLRRLLLIRPFFHHERGVKIETPFRVSRILWYLSTLVFIVPAVGFVCRQVFATLNLWIAGGTPLGASAHLVHTYLLQSLPYSLVNIDFLGERRWLLVGIAASLGFAFMMVVLPYTRAQAKVRLAHVARAAAYSLTWLIVPLALQFAAELLGIPAALQDQQRALSGTVAGIRDGLFEVVEVLQSNDLLALLTWATGIWCYAYWWHVLRRWWRMREALVAFVACAVPVTITVIVALVYAYL